MIWTVGWTWLHSPYYGTAPLVREVTALTCPAVTPGSPSFTRQLMGGAPWPDLLLLALGVCSSRSSPLLKKIREIHPFLTSNYSFLLLFPLNWRTSIHPHHEGRDYMFWSDHPLIACWDVNQVLEVVHSDIFLLCLNLQAFSTSLAFQHAFKTLWTELHILFQYAIHSISSYSVSHYLLLQVLFGLVYPDCMFRWLSTSVPNPIHSKLLWGYNLLHPLPLLPQLPLHFCMW